MHDATGRAWVTLILGTASLVQDTRSLFIWITSSPTEEEQDPYFETKIGTLVPTRAQSERGYRIEQIPRLGVEGSFFRSAPVDRLLRDGRDITIEIIENGVKPVDDYIRSHSRIMDLILRMKYQTARGKIFHDDSKVGLATDDFDTGSVKIYRTSYFRSVLTNDLTSKRILPRLSRPDSIYTGGRVYQGSPPTVPDLLDSQLSNHIGISTLVFTRDRKIVIWRQTDRAIRSAGLLVPTGSGSSDWGDVKHARFRFGEFLRQSSERELREESSMKEALKERRLETRITGYARVLSRGGKPDFYAVTKVAADSDELTPDGIEVNSPRWLVSYPARTLRETHKSLAQIMDSHPLSGALWLCAKNWTECIEEDEPGWCSFLQIPPG